MDTLRTNHQETHKKRKRIIAGREFVGPPKERQIAGQAMNNPELQALERKMLNQQIRGWYQSKVNLFDPKHVYKIAGGQCLTEERFARAARHKVTVTGSMQSLKWELFGLMKIIGLHKDHRNYGRLSIRDAEMEAWRLMLMTSQTLHPPKCKKIITERVHGVTVINFRVDEIHARRIWGANYVPVLSGKCLLAQRLLQQAHSSINWNLQRAQRTIKGTKAALQTGKLGICIKGRLA